MANSVNVQWCWWFGACSVRAPSSVTKFEQTQTFQTRYVAGSQTQCSGSNLTSSVEISSHSVRMKATSPQPRSLTTPESLQISARNARSLLTVSQVDFLVRAQAALASVRACRILERDWCHTSLSASIASERRGPGEQNSNCLQCLRGSKCIICYYIAGGSWSLKMWLDFWPSP